MKLVTFGTWLFMFDMGLLGIGSYHNAIVSLLCLTAFSIFIPIKGE